jgi:hypothetical protein
MAKALGFTNAISKLSREERQLSPSGNFGNDYNALRKIVMQNFPQVTDFVPPAVDIGHNSTSGSPFTRERYGEIFTFCEQIYQLLSAIGSGPQRT